MSLFFKKPDGEKQKEGFSMRDVNLTRASFPTREGSATNLPAFVLVYRTKTCSAALLCTILGYLQLGKKLITGKLFLFFI